MFWRVIKKDLSLFGCQEKISYPDIQKLNAIIDMDDDVEKAYNQYHLEKMEDK